VLANIPKETPEQWTALEVQSIKNSINAYHQGFGGSLGRGNGWEITNSINIYLLQFFNTFLKREEYAEFKTCKPLTKNTYIKCGSSI